MRTQAHVAELNHEIDALKLELEARAGDLRAQHAAAEARVVMSEQGRREWQQAHDALQAGRWDLEQAHADLKQRHAQLQERHDALARARDAWKHRHEELQQVHAASTLEQEACRNGP